MYYELYLDKFFLDNMILNYVLLLIVKQSLKCRTSWLRMALAAALGGAGMCVLVLLPIKNTGLYFLIGFGVLGLLMMKAGFPIKGRQTFIKGILVLYFSAFVLGGIWEMLRNYIRVSGLYLGAVSYIILRIMMKYYKKYKMKTEYLYDVTLSLNGKSKQVRGLCDTGNQLQQPFTGKPVSVIDYDSICEILEDDIKQQLCMMYNFQNGEITTEKISYIPYHSIGEKNGLLPGLKLDYVSIRREGNTQIIGGAIVAVSKESVSGKGEYQMILNPSIIES